MEAGYHAVPNAVPELDPITVHVLEGRHVVEVTLPGSGVDYELTTGTLNDVRAISVRPDDSLVFVLGFEQHGLTDADQAQTYVLGRIDRAGHATYAKVSAAMGYLVNGPGFVINDDGIAVMGSTTTAGVTVSYYPFN